MRRSFLNSSFLPPKICALAFCALLGSAIAPALAQTPVGNFSTTAAAPFALSGRISTDFVVGSGTVAHTPNTVLTAAHVIFEVKFGFETGTRFEQRRYGSQVARTTKAVRQTILSGYASLESRRDFNRAFGRDTGVVVTNRPAAANGTFTQLSTTTSLLLNSTTPKRVVGYPAARGFSGFRMFSVEPTQPFLKNTGVPNVLENRTFKAISGMSGGGVFVFRNNKWQVAAVTVAANSDDTEPWVRVVTAEVRNLINKSR